jgi:cell wall-associated NlpC family hydrolase
MLWVDKYIGIPYTKYGRERETGLDCWGLVREIYKNELGIELPSFVGEYEASKRVSINNVFDKEKNRWEALSKESEIQEFDVAAFHRFGVVYHTGVCLGKSTKMIHLENKAGCLVEDFSRFCVYGVYRYWEGQTL